MRRWLAVAFWTSIRISPFPLAKCGDALADDETLLESLERVRFAMDRRPRQHAARVLEGGSRKRAPCLQGGLGEPEEHRGSKGWRPSLCKHAGVRGLERKAVDDLSRQEWRIPHIAHRDKAQHLAYDDLDVLVMEVHAGTAIHALHFAHQVAGCCLASKCPDTNLRSVVEF